ncbi:MAG: type II toxin-antitoxin system VapC family toxin [Cyanobacteriota bacterium]
MDASVAFGWFAAVPGSEQAVRLLEASPPLRLNAPDLVLVELLNAGWRSQQAGAITTEQLDGIAQLAAGLFTALIPAASLLQAAHRWCRLLDHPAYDCLYLALAEREGTPLITQHQRRLRKLLATPEARRLALPLEAWPPS